MNGRDSPQRTEHMIKEPRMSVLGGRDMGALLTEHPGVMPLELRDDESLSSAFLLVCM